MEVTIVNCVPKPSIYHARTIRLAHLFVRNLMLSVGMQDVSESRCRFETENTLH